MGSQVYALAQLGFPFPKSSIEVQHILALGIWGLGIAGGNSKLDSARYFTKKHVNSNNMTNYIPHLCCICQDNL